MSERIVTMKRDEKIEKNILIYHPNTSQFFIIDDNMIMGEKLMMKVDGEIKGDKFIFRNIETLLKQAPDAKYKETYDEAIRRGWITGNGITMPKDRVKEEKIVNKDEDIAIAERIAEETNTNVEQVEKIHEGEIEEVSLVETNELSTSVVGGLPSFAEIKEYLDRYNYVKKTVVNRSDFHEYKSGGKTKVFMKKSGFRKFIHAFGLSVQVVKRESRLYFDDKTKRQGIEYEVWARCTAPNGQFTEDVAICQQYEKNSNKSKHDILTTATTRAINRAISNLVAYGEVSAEEVM